MWIAHDFRAARRGAPTALAIGNFDGVHRGHRHLLDRVQEAARAFGGESVALTFDPHPTRVLAPDRASPLVVGLDRKLELLRGTGVDATVVQRFDLSFSSQSPEEFAQQVVLGLRAREVFVGEDFHFGRNREGNGATLAALGAQLGFRAHVVPPLEEAGVPVSSSRVRRALADGDLAHARALLGRDYDLDGLVIAGQRRGRTLGFPTANLATECEALPRDGVYAVRVSVLGADGPTDHPAVMNLGSRPTFRAGRSLEAHLLDADVDLYGRTLRVTFAARLRDERRFDGVEALKEQIAADVRAARVALAAETGRMS
jgi:riboflavin kinase/FMN adenylyltransferase